MTAISKQDPKSGKTRSPSPSIGWSLLGGTGQAQQGPGTQGRLQARCSVTLPPVLPYALQP